MYHSITFIDENGVSKNTWDDWFMIPTDRPSFVYPKREIQISENPIEDGFGYDATQSLTGQYTVGLSEGTLTFAVDNGHANWVDRYSELLTFLHGKRLKAILEDEPDIYYEGRFKIMWSSEPDWSKVQISYSINKYHKSVGG